MHLENRSPWIWSGFLVAALLLMTLETGSLYGLLVPVGALAVAYGVPGARPRERTRHVDGADLVTVAVLYVAIVALLRIAFRVFTQDHVAGLFLTFAFALLLGVAGPVVYTVWRRGRPLADLGLSGGNLARTLALGLTLAAVQFAITLWGYNLPEPVDWVPLLVLALTVGVFESVFFRGFVQTRLQASLGTVPGIGGAAVLYGFYHVGYGMGAGEMLFLTGLGLVYGIAYALVRNVFVLWPLLTPVGSFYANMQGGDITMPWASILGFADVLALMATVVWLAARHQRRAQEAAPEPLAAHR
jgi:uncharacterized protein